MSMITSRANRWLNGDADAELAREARALRRRALPFAAAAVVGVVVAAIAPDHAARVTDWRFQVGAIGVGFGFVASQVWPASLARRTSLQAFPPLAATACMALVAASAGGIDSGPAVLLLLPLLWFGLTASDRQIAGALTFVLLCAVALVVLVDLPASGNIGWDHAVLLLVMALAAAVGLRNIAREHAVVHDLLKRAADTDQLTGLPNHGVWRRIAEVALAARFGPRACVVSLDLDGFKSLNDTYGHPAGDRALKETASAWSGALRAGDVLCRAGGDEFLVLLLGADAGTAAEVVVRLQGRTPGLLTCSAGIAEWDGAQTLDELVAAADGALYAAKATGRARFVIASPATARAAQQRRADQIAVTRPDDGMIDAADADLFSFDRLIADAGVIRLTALANHFISVSANCQGVLGWAPEQLLALSFSELVHPDDLPRTLAAAAQVDVAGRRVDGFVTRLRCADGTYRRLRFHAATDGRVWHAIAIAVGDPVALTQRSASPRGLAAREAAATLLRGHGTGQDRRIA